MGWARLHFQSASNGEQCYVCVFQAGYISVCEYVLSPVGSAQLQCEVISLQNTTTQPTLSFTHTHTHTLGWTRNQIFSSNPCQLPGRMAGMCVRHVYSEVAARSWSACGNPEALQSWTCLGAHNTRTHMQRMHTNYTDTHSHDYLLSGVSPLPTCHSNTQLMY